MRQDLGADLQAEASAEVLENEARALVVIEGDDADGDTWLVRL